MWRQDTEYETKKIFCIQRINATEKKKISNQTRDSAMCGIKFLNIISKSSSYVQLS